MFSQVRHETPGLQRMNDLKEKRTFHKKLAIIIYKIYNMIILGDMARLFTLSTRCHRCLSLVRNIGQDTSRTIH